MRKHDEIALFASLRCHRDKAGAAALSPTVDQIARQLGIPVKRAMGLAEKWYRKGWVECGVNIRWCWFTSTAPTALLVVGERYDA